MKNRLTKASPENVRANEQMVKDKARKKAGRKEHKVMPTSYEETTTLNSQVID
jgi:hypothetical protein